MMSCRNKKEIVTLKVQKQEFRLVLQGVVRDVVIETQDRLGNWVEYLTPESVLEGYIKKGAFVMAKDKGINFGHVSYVEALTECETLLTRRVKIKYDKLYEIKEYEYLTDWRKP